MCWSFEVSITTFIAATAAAIYLFKRNRKNDRFYATYIFVVGLMQGVEALAWYSINNKDKKLNEISGRFSEIFIWSQVLLVYLYLYMSSKKLSYLAVLIVTLVLMSMRIGKSAPYSIYRNPNCNARTECHLEWNWINPSVIDPLVGLYMLALFLPILLVKDRRRNWMLLVPIITLLFSYYKFNNTKVWSGYWCIATNLWIPIALFG